MFGETAVPWYVPIARAVPALILATVVTFTAEHSATLGLTTFGLFGLATGAVILVAALRQRGVVVERALLGVQGGIAILAGAAALAVPGAGLPFLILLLTGFAVVTGFIELYLGVRGRRTNSFGRDRIFLGGLTVLLAIAVLLVPPGFVQSFTGPDGVARALTAAVVVVGLLGAYWAIAGIHLVIAGLSLKWSTDPRTLSTVKGPA